jgi:CBS domain containing-hemolysin-like protein
MTGPDVALLITAILLIPAAGGLAAVDAAIARVSLARTEELVRERRRGAVALLKVVNDRARYTSLLLLLRVAAELTATVFVTVIAVQDYGSGWPVVLGTIAVMVLVCYVLIGVGPRTIGRQHPYSVALGGARLVLLLGRFLNPVASLLILLGNAITPGRG